MTDELILASQLTLEAGHLIDYHGQRHVILEVLEGGTLTLRNFETTACLQVAVSDLPPQPRPRPLKGDPDYLKTDEVQDDPLKIAISRYQTIEPLLGLVGRARTRAIVKERAELSGVHPATLYRWLDAFETSGKIDALSPRSRRDKDTPRVDTGVEAVIQAEIARLHPGGRLNVRALVSTVHAQCGALGLPLPHYNTVRNRVRAHAARAGEAEVGESG